MDTYLNLWYNVYASDINLLNDSLVLPEMKGMFFSEKLLELW